MSKIHLREEAQQFLSSLELVYEIEKIAEEPKHKLQVNEFVGFAAFAYEKLRNLVDYKDDVLLRKNAIKRLLRQRSMLTGVVKDETNAQDLLRELILSRYLPNNTISVTAVEQVAIIIKKYRLLVEELKKHNWYATEFRKWLIAIEALEIEHLLVDEPIRHPLTRFAYQLLQPVFHQASREADEHIYNRQLVITIQRVLEKADADILSFHLAKHLFPEWFNNTLSSEPEAAVRWSKIYQEVNKELNHSLTRRLQTLVRRALVPFIVLRVSIRSRGFKGLANFLTNPEAVAATTATVYESYYANLRSKIRRKGIHAMAYIFLTKIILAIALELPYESYILGYVNKIALLINLLIPPFLMLLITLLVTSPGRQNIDKLVIGTKEILYGSEDPIFLKAPYLAKKQRSYRLASLGLGILSAITFLASFGGIIYLLYLLDFNLLSGALFIFFVSLVSFFGVTLRQQVNALRVVPSKANIFTFLLDIVSLPMVWFGRWLSTTFDKVNVFVALMDFLIELPFKVILKFLDKWFSFLREKKEELF